jgi:hypothetical protein
VASTIYYIVHLGKKRSRKLLALLLLMYDKVPSWEKSALRSLLLKNFSSPFHFAAGAVAGPDCPEHPLSLTQPSARQPLTLNHIIWWRMMT